MKTAEAERDIENGLEELVARIHEYENALRFYARRSNWAALGRRKPIAVFKPAADVNLDHGDGMNGYDIARHILQKHGADPG